PLLAAAVEDANVRVAVDLQIPVGVGREPVVLVAVDDDRRVGPDPALAEELLEALPIDEIALQWILEIVAPVQLHGAGDVPFVVEIGILVDLGDDDALAP